MDTRMNPVIRMTKNTRFVVFMLFGLVLFVALLFPATSHATSAAGFNAGRIIDDGVLTNSSSMNISQIQDFLNSKVPACDTNGTQTSEFGGGTRAQWAASRGYYPPFTCLKDYSENGLSSAQIIYNVAQQYNINPQVLIVLLQKEEGLVTDTWPTGNQYRSATGYGCPDSTPGVCNSSYYGFTNQIENAAKLFHSVITQSPTWYSPYVLGNNYIQWSPNLACGGTTVNIQNLATASLYDYTPYRPNQASLNAGYGSGDGCSSYGNRNFYLYFTDWFGSTLTPSYSWSLVSVAADRDTSKLVAGEQALVTIVAKNAGTSNWYNHGTTPVKLATSHPPNRQSVFRHTSWVESNRPAVMSESGVAPNGNATFTFWIQAPATAGNYNEAFNLVAENLVTFDDAGFVMGIGVLPASGSGAVVEDGDLPTEMDVLDQYSTTIKLRNDTNITWRKASPYPMKLLLQFSNSQRSYSSVYDMQEDVVQPSETATFAVDLAAPPSTGDYTVSAKASSQNLKTFDGGVAKTVRVTSPPPYTDSGQYNDKGVDFNGDSTAEIATWNLTSGIWNSSAIGQAVTWGSQSAGDVPVPGDYDGDGKTDVAVWRKGPGMWYVKYSSDGSTHTANIAGKHGSLVAVPGDYDGDGKTDFAVWDHLTGIWTITRSSDGSIMTQQWGSQSAGDVPVPGDYDGDGKTDVAVWRKGPGMWYIRRSSNSTIRAESYGNNNIGDISLN